MEEEPKKLNQQLKIIEQGVTENDADFENAKSEIMDIISTGKGSLEQLMDIAAQSQHPRAYEVLANMINTLVGANKTILEMKVLNAKVKELNSKSSNPQNAKVVNQNLFVGSTREMQELLKKGQLE